MDIREKLIWLRSFAIRELNQNILPFWRENTLDSVYGGFYGEISHNMDIVSDAPKGLILYSRVLWTFSAAYQITNDETDKKLAKRAFDYLVRYFYDQEFGGYFWTVTAQGEPLETKKQIYALAFAMYGMSEYYKISNNEDALDRAKSLFSLIEKHSFDTKLNGYTEAFARNWDEMGEIRLSAKDMNEKKSMNTHLHVVEAYANLYSVWKDKTLEKQLKNLVEIFLDKIISPEDYHLNLFFDENWNVKSSVVSYGHDIEAGWLIHESALIHGDKSLIERVEKIVPHITDVALEGISELGGLYHESDRAGQHIDHEMEWWPQAESLVGLVNTYQVTHNEKYIDFAITVGRFTDKYMIDKQRGEWFYRVDENGHPVEKYVKTGLWKCPYHNSRACLEIIKRVGELI